MRTVGSGSTKFAFPETGNWPWALVWLEQKVFVNVDKWFSPFWSLAEIFFNGEGKQNKTKQNPKTPCQCSALFSPAVASRECENVFNWNHRTSSQPTLNGFLCAAFCQSFKQDCTRKEKNVVFTDTQPCKNNSGISSQCIHCSSLTVPSETNRHVTLLPVGPQGGLLIFLIFA